MAISSWGELYSRVVPTVASESMFERLETDARSFVLVTGCQRSGTSWLRKLLGEAIPGAAAPPELEACNFLINGHDLDTSAPVIVLQTTFANVRVDSYAHLRGDVPVVLIARNPFSVCQSLVYNWGNLASEHAHRRGTTEAPTRVLSEREQWWAAIDMYCQSMDAGIDILTRRTHSTTLVTYDELVHNVAAGLKQLSRFLGRPLEGTVANATADLAPSAKQAALPAAFRELVAQHCVPRFTALRETSAALGNRIDIS